MCQLWWEGTLGCTAVGGEANRLRAGSLYRIVHCVHPENRDKYSQWQWPITEDQGFYLSFALRLSIEEQTFLCSTYRDLILIQAGSTVVARWYNTASAICDDWLNVHWAKGMI